MLQLACRNSIKSEFRAHVPSMSNPTKYGNTVLLENISVDNFGISGGNYKYFECFSSRHGQNETVRMHISEDFIDRSKLSRKKKSKNFSFIMKGCSL